MIYCRAWCGIWDFLHKHTPYSSTLHHLLPSKLGTKFLKITLCTIQSKLVYVMLCLLDNKLEAGKKNNIQYSKTVLQCSTNGLWRILNFADHNESHLCHFVMVVPAKAEIFTLLKSIINITQHKNKTAPLILFLVK